MPSKNFSKEAANHICLCSSMQPCLTLYRLFGIFPVVTEHKNGYCVFKKSNSWIIYSGILTFIFALIAIFTTDIFNIFNLGTGKSLHGLMDSINNVLYGIYITSMTFLNAIRFDAYSKCFNSINTILKHGLLCQSALRTVQRVQKVYIVFLIVVVFLQMGSLVYLHTSTKYVTDFTTKTIFNRAVQCVTFIFYSLFVATCSIFIGSLGCFEKLIISAFRYSPIHPMKGIDETNNSRDFLGVVKFSVCTEVHPASDYMKSLNPAELIEFLRCLHEEISVIIYTMNDCLNPQILCHTVIELSVLILHWYSVIIYLAYEFTSPYAATMHVLNCIFVLVHTLGLFMFLKNAQHLHNMVHGLTNFLLEFSTRITLPEEHQQIRLFIEKLKLHRPLTASGVFTVDLGIAGPICANILTYVLVALQFEVPKS